jgi:O-antigen ligase
VHGPNFGKVTFGTIIQKSEYRFKLYKNGYLAFMASPFVGFGLGPYSGDDSPFHRREVHNSFFDWVLNTGILGGIAMIALFIWSTHRLWSKHCYSLFCGLIIIGFFAQFHHVIRHPIVWIFLILALKVVDQKDSNLTGSPSS